MGLAIETGVLAHLLKYDQEGADWLATTLEGLNRVLVKHGLPPHDEPRELPHWQHRGECGSFPYSYLHFLRRAISFSRHDPAGFAPAAAGWEPSLSDPWLDYELTVYMDAHTICHSDSQGFYVPIDFDMPIYGDAQSPVVGGIVGSTNRARMELIAVAPLLGIELDGDELSDAQAAVLAGERDGAHPLWIERLVWFTFFEATTASLRYKTAIVFH
ncbi:MAG: hypothetical protein ACJ8CR_35785 [Roseiflexaceae bacterium]